MLFITITSSKINPFSCKHRLRGGGGGGGRRGHFHWRLYRIRVNRPRKSTLDKDSRGDPKAPLTGDMGQLSHPNCGLLSCSHDQLYPKSGLFSYFIPQTRITYQKRLWTLDSDILNLVFYMCDFWTLFTSQILSHIILFSQDKAISYYYGVLQSSVGLDFITRWSIKRSSSEPDYTQWTGGGQPLFVRSIWLTVCVEV